jgi:hypothetical protein
MKKYSYTRTIRLPWGWRVIIRRESGPRAGVGAGKGKLVAWDMADSEPTALANEALAGQQQAGAGLESGDGRAEINHGGNKQ